MKKALITLVTITALIGAGCGGSSSGGDAAIPGKEGAPSEADREIEVVGTDSLEFDPEDIEVEVGETITFVVTNSGEIEHEFVLGNAAYQAEHEEEMSGGGDGGHVHGGGDPNILGVAPGETGEITWTFTEAGEVLYGCHEPGHYKGGMVGTITVG